jgi:HAD superfamily hydrolase (TIGR01509 family)
VIAVVLFDLDGVVRHFDRRNVADIERRHGIEEGAIELFAFSSPLIEDVTTGRISRRDWVERIAEHLGSYDAAAEWGHQPFSADLEVLALVDALRARGLRTAILTNGTDTIPAETSQLGLDSHFDAVFNSATIGYAKPDRRAFQHVVDSMGVAAREVFFTDDSPAKLVGAARLGMMTHHYTGSAELERALRDNGVPFGPWTDPRTAHLPSR